jgi:hypothetical protein
MAKPHQSNVILIANKEFYKKKSMSEDVTSSESGANHLVTVSGSICKWTFSEIVSTEYCCDQVK